MGERTVGTMLAVLLLIGAAGCQTDPLDEWVRSSRGAAADRPADYDTFVPPAPAARPTPRPAYSEPIYEVTRPAPAGGPAHVGPGPLPDFVSVYNPTVHGVNPLPPPPPTYPPVILDDGPYVDEDGNLVTPPVLRYHIIQWK